jgi:hypothetical protein
MKGDKLMTPKSSLGGSHMRTESAGVGHGLSERTGFNATECGDGPISSAGGNGFTRDVKTSQTAKSVSEKGVSFTIDGGC